MRAEHDCQTTPPDRTPALWRAERRAAASAIGDGRGVIDRVSRWRRIGIVLALVLGAWPWVSVGHAVADDDAGTEVGILFRVQPAAGGAPSALFGTIHSEDHRVVELPEPVRTAFETSPRIALEVVPDSSAVIKAMITMTYTDGRTLRDVLPSDLYTETAAALGEIGMSEDAFKDIKPWAVVTMISAPPAKTGEFLDMMLYRQSVEAGKQVTGLETMTEQLALFEGLSASEQIALLRETLAARQDLPEMFEALTTAYLARDTGELQRLSDAYLAANEPALAQHFQEVIIDARNRRMVERMAPLLAQGDWFIAIGALHLPGPNGVLELLRSRGYSVTVLH